MNIGIVDADLLGREHHRFPNLACMKISAYHKELGDEVSLILDYHSLDHFDKIYISKVFTDTPILNADTAALSPDALLQYLSLLCDPKKINLGGTGFYFDKAPNLDDAIEHHMPDYHLYDKWIGEKEEEARKKAEKENKEFNRSKFLFPYKEYTDYSIGFVTRGCFRKCGFCVNKKYDHVFPHSPLDEFYDSERPRICLLDDNFFGYGLGWKRILQELIDTGKPFKFKQGLDERLLTDEKCKILFDCKYDGDFTFAFDNISDYELIHSKLKLIRKYSDSRHIRFYVLVGYESTGIEDIRNAFRRIELLQRYGTLPYIMRFQNKNETPWKKSEWRGMYVAIARWCNQPNFFKRLSFREFCDVNQKQMKSENGVSSTLAALHKFEKEDPVFAREYFDKHFNLTTNYD